MYPYNKTFRTVCLSFFIFLVVPSYVLASGTPAGGKAAKSGCDPNSASVTKNVTLLQTYVPSVMKSGSIQFDKVVADGSIKQWMPKNQWEVCGKPAIVIGNLGYGGEDEMVFYNNKLYSVPAGADPLMEVHTEIAYRTGRFGKAIVGKETFDLADVSAQVRSVNGKIAAKLISGDYKNRKTTVYFDGKKIGTYATVPSDIKVIGGKPTFIAALDAAAKNSLKQRTVMVQGGKVVSKPNEFVGSFVDVKGSPAYVATLSSPLIETGNKDIPIMSNPRAKYQVMWRGKAVSLEYDFITNLTVVNGKLGFVALREKRPLVVYDGREYGEQYISVGSITDVNGKLAFVGAREDGNKNLVYEVVKDDEVVARFDKPYVFYPERGTRGWGDVTFVGGKVVMVVRREDQSESYVQYGDEKILQGYEVAGVSNIGGKLVIKASQKNQDVLLIEK